VVHVIDVAETTETEAQAVPPTVTDAPDKNPVPVIVIDVPPAAAPDEGDTPDTVGGATTSNCACTEMLLDCTVTTHVESDPDETQSPPHPTNSDNGDAVAVKVTVLPEANESVHVEPQLIPPEEATTVPVPDPLRDTETVYAVACVTFTGLKRVEFDPSPTSPFSF
jgi:hypothetical protein